MLRAMETLGIDYGDPKREDDAKMVFDIVSRMEDTEAFTQEVKDALVRLWTDSGIQVRAASVQLRDSQSSWLNG